MNLYLIAITTLLLAKAPDTVLAASQHHMTLLLIMQSHRTERCLKTAQQSLLLSLNNEHLSIEIKPFEDECSGSVGLSKLVRLLNNDNETSNIHPLVLSTSLCQNDARARSQLFNFYGYRMLNVFKPRFSSSTSSFSVFPALSDSFKAVAEFSRLQNWQKVFMLFDMEWQNILIDSVEHFLKRSIDQVISSPVSFSDDASSIFRAVDSLFQHDARIIVVMSDFFHRIACHLFQKRLYGPNYVIFAHLSAIDGSVASVECSAVYQSVIVFGQKTAQQGAEDSIVLNSFTETSCSDLFSTAAYVLNKTIHLDKNNDITAEFDKLTLVRQKTFGNVHFYRQHEGNQNTFASIATFISQNESFEVTSNFWAKHNLPFDAIRYISVPYRTIPDEYLTITGVFGGVFVAMEMALFAVHFRFRNAKGMIGNSTPKLNALILTGNILLLLDIFTAIGQDFGGPYVNANCMLSNLLVGVGVSMVAGSLCLKLKLASFLAVLVAPPPAPDLGVLKTGVGKRVSFKKSPSAAQLANQQRIVHHHNSRYRDQPPKGCLQISKLAVKKLKSKYNDYWEKVSKMPFPALSQKVLRCAYVWPLFPATLFFLWFCIEPTASKPVNMAPTSYKHGDVYAYVYYGFECTEIGPMGTAIATILAIFVMLILLQALMLAYQLRNVCILKVNDQRMAGTCVCSTLILIVAGMLVAGVLFRHHAIYMRFAVALIAAIISIVNTGLIFLPKMQPGGYLTQTPAEMFISYRNSLRATLKRMSLAAVHSAAVQNQS